MSKDAVSLITGIAGAVSNPISTLITNWQNSQAIEEQNKWNLEQWNRENLYNSPAEQMKRLKAAGLNPNLMYGDGAGSLLSAPSPTMQANRNMPPQVDPLTMAQINNINADTKQKEKSTISVDLANWRTNFENQIMSDNAETLHRVAAQQMNALGMQSENEYWQAAYSASIIASIFDGLETGAYLNDGTPEYAIGSFHMTKELADKFKQLGVSELEQQRLEYSLYRSYVEAQKKINKKAGEEADMEAVVPTMINDCPKWLQPVLIAAWQLFKTAKVPSFSLGKSK